MVQEAEHSRWLLLSYWLPAARFLPLIWTGELWREFQASMMEWRFVRSLGICRAPASASHRSTEPGHELLLAELGLGPLLDLGLRLGEGSGAALALPLLSAAAAVLSGMATFEAAGVTDAGA